MDEVSPTKDPQEPGMSDGTPLETGANLGAELSAESSPDGPGRERSGPNDPAAVERARVEQEAAPSEQEAATPEAESTPLEPEPIPVEPEAETVEPEPIPVEPEAETLEPEPIPVEPEPETLEPEAVPSEPEPAPPDPEPTPIIEVEPTPADLEPAPIAAEPTPAEVETPGPDAAPAPEAAPAVEAPVAKAPAAEATDEEKSFDPAADLPTYREGMDWFVLRVASNKENYVRETLLRKVQIEGLDDRVGRIMVPTEKTKTLKGGKTKITETKLYPGYIFVEMRLETDGRIPQDVFFLIKETTGVGDFVGTAGRPTPMAVHEAEKMLFDSRRPEETPSVKMEFAPGDYVTITEGPFESYEGTVDEVLPDKGLVRVLVTIFGRQAPVELEYWQIQKAE
jgi:transcriptional antiterminator NusG